MRERVAREKAVYEHNCQTVDQFAESKRAQLTREIEFKYPIPPVPRKPYSKSCKPGMTAMQVRNEDIKESIMELMEDGKVRSVDDIKTQVSLLNNYTDQSAVTAIRNLVEEGYLTRTENNGYHLFIISD